jgi:hypothetical protein
MGMCKKYGYQEFCLLNKSLLRVQQVCANENGMEINRLERKGGRTRSVE